MRHEECQRKRKQLGAALMAVLSIKAAFSVLLGIKPDPFPTLLMFIVFMIGLVYFLVGCKDDTTD